MIAEEVEKLIQPIATEIPVLTADRTADMAGVKPSDDGYRPDSFLTNAFT